MVDSQFKAENQPHDAMRPPAGDELLPPVEPPSAGFIIQLFVVPALIVMVIVAIWFSFNWLVRRTATRPQDLIQGLEQGPAIARWQRASELADTLRNERFADFKRSPESAAHLARILASEIEQAGMDEGEVTLRYFLARALGEFQVPEGLDVLVEAAQTDRDPREQIVRHGALEAIAVRAYNLRQLDEEQNVEQPELEAALMRLADEEDPLIRSQTAYTLGQLGTPAAIERLESMADDPDADTRYNAAIALAHRGNDRSVETLSEMLDLKELASLREDEPDAARALKRRMIVHTAIEATEELARKKPHADLALVVEALEQLANAASESLDAAQLPPRAAAEARDALNVIAQETSADAAP